MKNGSDFIDETNKGDPIAVIKSLWDVNEELCRGFIALGDVGDGTLIPHINLMARWRTMQLGKQIDEYNLSCFHVFAAVLRRSHSLSAVSAQLAAYASHFAHR